MLWGEYLGRFQRFRRASQPPDYVKQLIDDINAFQSAEAGSAPRSSADARPASWWRT